MIAAITWLLAALSILLVVFIALRIFIVFRQVPKYAAYWAQLASNPQTQDSILYVALGDSAAQGVGAAKPQQSYVGQLADRMNSATNKEVHTVNLSVSGARVRDALKVQLPKLHDLVPSKTMVVTIEIGANDVKELNPKQFRRDIDKLFGQLPSNTVVGNIPYFGGGLFRRREANVTIANQLVEELAKKYKFPVADLHRYTKEHDSLLNYGGDFFHPNKRGYKNWADAFWDVLEPRF